MKIDEILCNIARNNALTFSEEEQDAMAEAILSVQELQWYREQDLIKRNDLNDVIEEEYRCSNCNNHAREDCEWCVANSFKQIPKAEYGRDK